MFSRLFLLFISMTCLIEIVPAADAVVIHSHETEVFHQGQLINTEQDITLPKQAMVTVVFASGDVQTITGPYQGQLIEPLPHTQVDSDFIANFVAALDKIDQKKKEWGVLRIGPIKKTDDIWRVDVTSTTPTNGRFFCIAPASNVVLWRPQSQSKSAATVLIKHRPTGKEAKAVWPAYQTTLKWPQDLPVIDGETYNVELKTRQGAFTFKRLVLYKVPDSLPTNSHKVVWMVGRGCISQANMLLASLR